MPIKLRHIVKKGINKQDVLYLNQETSNTTKHKQRITNNSIRINKEQGTLQEGEEIVHFGNDTTNIKIKIGVYNKYKDILNGSGLIKFNAGEDDLYSIKKIRNLILEYKCISNKYLKNILMNDVLFIHFLNELRLHKEENLQDIKAGPYSSSNIAKRACNKLNATDNEIAGERHQVNVIIKFLYILSGGRLDYRTNNLDENGIFDLTGKKQSELYCLAEYQLNLLKKVKSRDKRRIVNYKLGEFKS